MEDTPVPLWFYSCRAFPDLDLPVNALLLIEPGVAFRRVWPDERDVPSDWFALEKGLTEGTIIPLTHHEAAALPSEATGRSRAALVLGA